MKSIEIKKASAPTEARDRKVIFTYKEFNTMAPIEAKDIPEYPYSPEPKITATVPHRKSTPKRRKDRPGKLLVSSCLGVSTFLNAYILTLGVSAQLDGYPLPYWAMIVSLMLFSSLVGFGAWTAINE